LKLNQAGLDLIKSFEGLYLKSYLCPAGVWTIGYGTTIYPSGQHVASGQTCTEAEANEFFMHDINEKYSKYVTNSNIYPKLQNSNEFSALVSFVYNVGGGGLSAPNSINRRIAEGNDYKKVVATELPRWVNKGSSFEVGLTRRRKAEIALFNTPADKEEQPVKEALYFTVGESDGEEVKAFQKTLNVWLVKYGKTKLDEDGWFGNLSLVASNDYARNNKLPETAGGVTKALVDTVRHYTNVNPPPHTQPSIVTYKRSEATTKLAPNFTAGEFFCKCGYCAPQLVSPEVVAKLQLLRAALGDKPMSITSAYRCRTHNTNVGGASASRHLVGDAVDISIAGVSWQELVREAKKIGFTGIGYGQHLGFIHLDLGEAREWDY